MDFLVFLAYLIAGPGFLVFSVTKKGWQSFFLAILGLFCIAEALITLAESYPNL